MIVVFCRYLFFHAVAEDWSAFEEKLDFFSVVDCDMDGGDIPAGEFF
ncbi:MAG: hypothetical protein RRY34_10650 [Victivallaceae bacterium]